MQHRNIHLDGYVDFDTMIDGTLTDTLFNKLVMGPQEDDKHSAVTVDDSMTALSTFSALGLIDFDPQAFSSIPNSVARIQEFVNRFDNPQNVQFAAINDLSSNDVDCGVASFSTYLFAKLFLSRFDPKDGSLRTEGNGILPVNGGDGAKITGKIRDYIFIRDLEGDTKGRGHLSVDVLFELCRNDEYRKFFYHWDIEIHNYTVHFRDDSRFPRFPFPELEGKPDAYGNLTEDPKIIFPEFSLDEDDDRSIWKRDLNHKLFAEGKDEYGKDNFTIQNIFQSVDDGPLQRLENEGANAHPWYKTKRESCIDLMFTGYPPAAGLPPQTNYCLGRCKHPLIINTCGG